MARPKKEETQGDPAMRQRLLEAALTLFNSKGYAATSVREIVEATGVSKPVLYYYFKNKEGIYLELMADTYATFQELVTQLAASQGIARERIIRFATGIFDTFVERIDVARLIYAIFFGPPQGAPYFPHEQYYDTMLHTLGGMVSDGMGQGEFRAVNADDVTWTILSCMNTIMEEQLCQIPPRVDRDGLERMLNLVLDGIAPGGR